MPVCDDVGGGFTLPGRTDFTSSERVRKSYHFGAKPDIPVDRFTELQLDAFLPLPIECDHYSFATLVRQLIRLGMESLHVRTSVVNAARR